VTKWCADVAPVGCLPRVGDCWSGDVAAVARLRPTLLIGSVPFKGETLQKLLGLGVPLVALNPRSLADIYSDMRLLGRITGRNAAAEGLIRKMRRELKQNAVGRPRGARPLRVYCEAWPNPRITSPPWVDELVRMAGAEPATEGGTRITDAEVARARPDVIVLAWTATGTKADPRSALRNPAWRDIPAVRNARVFVVPDELLNTPSPVLVRGLGALRRCLAVAARTP
jgi:iron complex transport system substrate-binding protein